MRTIHIYQPGTYQLHDAVLLSEGASHHVSRVLRMRTNDALTLFCGDNHTYSARIIAIQKHWVTVRIEGVRFANRESPCIIHLAQGIAKKEQMAFIIQKAVELGVASITPVITQHCTIKLDANQLAKRYTQWESIAVGACEQSGRNKLPVIHPPCHFETYLAQNTTPYRYLLDPKSETNFRDGIQDHTPGEISLLIGPEGGLHPEEISNARAAKFQGISLGPRILRTETATLTALSVLQAFLGDL